MNTQTQIISSFSPLDRTLPEEVIHHLQARHKVISTAESLTGGGVGQALTAVPGASNVYAGGLIAYTDRIKTDLLQVPPELLREYSAVSPQCAQAMAANVRRIFHTDLAVATTGFAGPGGGNEHYPVGTVFVALNNGQDTFIKHLQFIGLSRAQVREMTVGIALQMIIAQL